MMKATIQQLKQLSNLEKDFCIKVISDYGFYSNGDIGVLCKDNFGEFAIKINTQGIVNSKK